MILLCHGNSKSLGRKNHPYIRTSDEVLECQSQLIENNLSSSEIYGTLLEETGGLLTSTLMCNEPRNLKQIENRKASLKRKQNTTIILPNTDVGGDLEEMISLQRQGKLKTLTITGNTYIGFHYTDRQMNDIEKFCCHDSEKQLCVLGKINLLMVHYGVFDKLIFQYHLLLFI